MSLGKLPGIKGLVASSQSKRRFKSDLSVDMISPPLGDFRHTMHVGRGGDVFGDTSFLSNHGGRGGGGGARSPESPSASVKSSRFFSRTLRHVRKVPPPRMRAGSRDLSLPPPPISPIIKNAVSLPQLNMDMGNGYVQRTLFPSSLSSPGDSLYSYGLQSGFVTLPRLSRHDKQSQDSYGTLSPDFRRGSLLDNGSLTRSDSLSSFTVDLGPSLMSEVLGMIDNPNNSLSTNHHWCKGDEAGDLDEDHSSVFESVTESPVRYPASVGAEDSPYNSRGRSCSPEWGSETLNGDDSNVSARATPDASMWSPAREEPGIEVGQFRRAVDVLARHYGGGSQVKGRRCSSDETNGSSVLSHREESCTYPDDEEEIKV
ncbi:cdc42 effector protein 1-like [Clupea harengus]|uniref:Cdc42 effector protein 1-like n=1 Tax=Clupea harengus TaxID=7950 RepID=A0A6P3VTK8_CLUHA|nr:cdc42 effector protein 1-like [Clupea harengus]